MSYLKDREVWLEKTPTGNPPAGYYWKFIQDGVVVVRDSDGVDKVSVSDEDIINDLTTGGATKVLSAEQGVTLEDTKQATLVSGTNIKTINGDSVLGAGDLEVGGGKVLQVVFAETSTLMATASTAFVDTNLTATITPTETTSTIYVVVDQHVSLQSAFARMAVVKGSSEMGNRVSIKINSGATFDDFMVNIKRKDVHGVGTAITYKTQIAIESGGTAVRCQRVNDSVNPNEPNTSTMMLIEVE